MGILPKSLVFGSAVASIAGVACLIRDRNGGVPYEGDEKLTDKVVIVTGANTGIGKEVARDMARREAKVVMACRDMAKCEKAREEIVWDTKNRYVYCRMCDLASQESIREFVKLFKKEHDKLHILINNAGVMRCPLSHTKEGIEMQIGVNHMGHFLLTNLLLDRLKASAPARIVNVSSLAHMKGKMNMSDLNSDEVYDAGAAYAQSKLANVLFTRELHKRLRDTGIVVAAVHPGIVDTEINRHLSYHNSYFSTIFLKPLIWPWIRTPKQGAQTVIYAALSPEVEKLSGFYFSDCAIAKMNPITTREMHQLWLWKVSEKWTNLNETES